MTITIKINCDNVWKACIVIWCIFNAITSVMLVWNSTHATIIDGDFMKGISAKECFTDLFTQNKICWEGTGYFSVPAGLDIAGGIITYSILWWYYNNKNKWIEFECSSKKEALIT